ncbi:flagellar biosynthesis protein FlgB [Buchnera aphidicola (Diuraphis noxia)]|uniref:Flagellar basal body rod protein FlgB n=1 Tax=Buchnera aphidicola subsp. Diuraphis noxia TaxID=118101 RepID=A0A1B2H8J9_BUCDN|nr:flagellar basal body rod protein FlgB [Buchnera aphidicola]ANZ22543.1 flagellar biosynthesis protein FlgB [Buchnera aphidicola (Diuraphis noxia)]
MFNKIHQIFDFNQKSLNLYAKRQEILASNIANSDTPGYKSVDINFFNEFNKIKNYSKHTNIALSKTSPNHLNAKKDNFFSPHILSILTNQIKPDGNTVDMDRERIEFLNNSLKYESNLAFMKNDIKNIMYILQG